MPDHVHLACSMPPKLSAAELIGRIKGGSSHFINHLPEVQADITLCLYWQPGYGWLTYTKNEMPRITAYIDNQKAHHTTGRTWGKMERASSLLQQASPGRSPALQGRE